MHSYLDFFCLRNFIFLNIVVIIIAAIWYRKNCYHATVDLISFLLCFPLLCFALLCSALLSFALPCFAFAVSAAQEVTRGKWRSRARSRNVSDRRTVRAERVRCTARHSHGTLRCVVLCCVELCCVVLSVLCCIVLCCVVLCYVVLCWVVSVDANGGDISEDDCSDYGDRINIHLDNMVVTSVVTIVMIPKGWRWCVLSLLMLQYFISFSIFICPP